MTIASSTSRIGYTGDGVTTAFAVPFFFSANSDLVVSVQDLAGNVTTKVLGTDYNLTGATVSTGGTCTFVVAPTTGYLLAVTRVPPLTQTTSYNNNDPFPAKSHEAALDKLTTEVQYLKSLIDRTMLVAPTDTPPMTTLPPASVRALKNLSFDNLGNPSVSVPITGTTVSSVMIPVVTASTLAIARSALGVDSTGNSFATRALAIASTIDASVQSIRLAGYTTAADGGGGLYKRVGSLPAGTLGFQSADGAWWQYAESIQNVLAFGADKTGATNSAVAINNAIVAAKLIQGIVYLPAGTYDVTGIGVNLTNNAAGLTIQGDGLTGTKITANGVTNAVLDMTGGSAITVKDLTISCTDVGGTKYAILSVASATLSNNVNHFTNVSITGFWRKAAVYIYSSSDSSFTNSQVSNFSTVCTACVYMTATNDLAATSNFTTITTTITGQSGDWRFSSFEIHDLSTFSPATTSTVIPLFISGIFSPIKFIGGVIAGSVAAASGGMVTFGGVPTNCVSFIGTQFYGDNGIPSKFAFWTYNVFTGLVVQGSAIQYGTSFLSQANGSTWDGLSISGNSFSSGSFVTPTTAATITRSLIDARSLAINLGAGGTLTHTIMIQPGAITAGTQTANGSF